MKYGSASNIERGPVEEYISVDEAAPSETQTTRLDINLSEWIEQKPPPRLWHSPIISIYMRHRTVLSPLAKFSLHNHNDIICIG